MIRAHTPDQVRAAEAELMAQLPDGELMARAAEGLALVANTRLSERGGTAVAALVGPGNNGGDTLYAAARLAANGASVVAVHGDWPLHEGGRESAAEAGVVLVGPGDDWRRWLDEADLVIDGLLGIGGRPGLTGLAAQFAAAIGDDAYVLSVDLPSGADPLGEQATGEQVFADETVTFGVPKPVHVLPPGEAASGLLTVVDIGLEVAAAAAVERLEHDDVARLWPVPGPADDKYARGVLGVVAGGEGYTGAPVLCTTAAVCAGAGMVRYIGPSTPTGLVRAAVPEAVFGPGRVQAWLVGPGLDPADDSDAGRAQTRAARDALGSGAPCVVDAGGLDLLEAPRTTPTLLTPHAGEAARMLTRLGGAPVERAEVESAPLVAARRLAALTGATVLLKGSTTLVVGPGDGAPVRSQNDGPAWLATAGSGDVLAGLAGMLLAAGLDPLAAGSLAALVHGVAGDRANPGGPVRALGVAHAIPVAVAGLLARPGSPV